MVKLGEVTIVKGCMICREEVILMATRDGRGELPEKDTIMPEVCGKCESKYLIKGVLLINPNNGKLVVIKNEAFEKMFDTEIPKHKIAFTDDEVLDRIMGGVEKKCQN